MCKPQIIFERCHIFICRSRSSVYQSTHEKGALYNIFSVTSPEPQDFNISICLSSELTNILGWELRSSSSFSHFIILRKLLKRVSGEATIMEKQDAPEWLMHFFSARNDSKATSSKHTRCGNTVCKKKNVLSKESICARKHR